MALQTLPGTGAHLLRMMGERQPLQSLTPRNMIQLRKALNSGWSDFGAFDFDRRYPLVPEVEQIGRKLFDQSRMFCIQGRVIDGAFMAKTRENDFTRALGLPWIRAITEHKIVTIMLVDFYDFGSARHNYVPVFEVTLGNGQSFQYINPPWQTGVRFHLHL